MFTDFRFPFSSGLTGVHCGPGIMVALDLKSWSKVGSMLDSGLLLSKVGSSKVIKSYFSIDTEGFILQPMEFY